MCKHGKVVEDRNIIMLEGFAIGGANGRPTANSIKGDCFCG